MGDVLIIGGGLAGCAVAWSLAPHLSVTLLEQGEQLGAEASAHNAGMVRRLGEDAYERALAVRTSEWLSDPGPEFAGASRRVGALLGLVHDPWHLHDAGAHLRARGVRAELCDRPVELAPALAGTPLGAAWYLPDERVADAHILLRGFVSCARRHGARFETSEPVRRLIIRGGRVRGVETAQRTWEAEQVVIAAGAWSAILAARAGLERPLFPLRRTLLQTAPHPLAQADHPWCWIDDVGLYARPEAGGWLMSACDERVDPPVERPGSRGPVEPEVRALLHAKLDRWMPALGDVRVQTGWSGLRTFAPDRRPYLGPDPDIEGLHWAAGLGGYGVTCCAAVGEVVGAWLRGVEVPWMHPAGVGVSRALLRRWEIRPQGDLHDGVLVDGRSAPIHADVEIGSAMKGVAGERSDQ